MNNMLTHAAATPPEDSTTRSIPLAKGKFATVDAADFEWLSQWKWHISNPHRDYFVARSVSCETGKLGKAIHMHRLILGVASGRRVKHIDGNGLNNCRSNLAKVQTPEGKQLEGDTRIIPLTQGMVATVDASDYKWLIQWTWYAHYNDKREAWVAARYDPIKHTVFMHREIMGAPDGTMVDHRDGNGLHNCRINLRLATNQQNLCNRGAPKSNTSGFKGVSWHRNRWRAKIQSNGKHFHLGRFKDINDAARAYDAAAKVLHGEFARVNFLDEKSSNQEKAQSHNA